MLFLISPAELFSKYILIFIFVFAPSYRYEYKDMNTNALCQFMWEHYSLPSKWMLTANVNLTF